MGISLAWGLQAFGGSAVVALAPVARVETPIGPPPPAPRGAAIANATFETPVMIRVRVGEALEKARVRGFDLKIYHTGDVASPAPGGRVLASTTDQVTEWEFQCSNGAIRAIALFRGGDGKGIRGIRYLDLKEPATIESPSGFVTFSGKPYREEIRVFTKGNGCEVVNVLDLEKYLDGLVNAEFSARWRPEAIGAQVVAARTYALFQIQNRRKQHFDVDATERDQVYDGSIREDFRASRTVERTRGLVLTVGPESAPLPLKAFYHATCGGRTDLPQYVWGRKSPGFRRAVKCGFCKKSPRFRWELEMRSEDFVEAIIRGAGLAGRQDLGWPKDAMEVVLRRGLVDVRVIKKDPFGRALKIMTEWQVGDRKVALPVSALRLREWIGARQVSSTAFTLGARRGPAATGAGRPIAIRFEGRGNGHGVGMCQWGAKFMGDKGFTMAKILKHYYPDATVRKLW